MINVVIALSDTARAVLAAVQADPELRPELNTVADTITKSDGSGGLFTEMCKDYLSLDTGVTYKAFSYYTDEAGLDLTDQLLAGEFAGEAVIGGAWYLDGRQVGTEWEIDEEGDLTGNTTGTPRHPVQPLLIAFMPDVWDNTDPENPVQVAATELAQIHKISGQKDRRFT